MLDALFQHWSHNNSFPTNYYIPCRHFNPFLIVLYLAEMRNGDHLPLCSSCSCVWRLLSYLPTHFLFQSNGVIRLVLPYRTGLSASEKGSSGKVKHSSVWWSLKCLFDLAAPLVSQPKNPSSHKTSFTSVQKPARLGANKWTGSTSYKHVVHVVFSAVDWHVSVSMASLIL